MSFSDSPGFSLVDPMNPTMLSIENPPENFVPSILSKSSINLVCSHICWR